MSMQRAKKQRHIMALARVHIKVQHFQQPVLRIIPLRRFESALCVVEIST